MREANLAAALLPTPFTCNSGRIVHRPATLAIAFLFIWCYFYRIMPPDYEDRTEYTVRHKAFEESFKLYYDASKHLTTLNTGAILIVLTIFEKMFNDRGSSSTMVLALACFILSIIISIIAMLMWGTVISLATNLTRTRYWVSAGTLTLAYFVFVGGLLALMKAIMSNAPQM